MTFEDFRKKVDIDGYDDIEQLLKDFWLEGNSSGWGEGYTKGHADGETFGRNSLKGKIRDL